MKIALLLAALFASVANAHSGDHYENQYLLDSNKTYENPVSNFKCADPGVFRTSGGKGFVACTGGSFGTGRFPLFRSSDMVHWKKATRPTLFNAGYKEPWSSPDRSWAPAIAYVNNRFVTYYTQNDKNKNGAIGVAYSNDLGNKYFRSDRKTPLVSRGGNYGVIDPSYFYDKDTKKHYLLYKTDANGVLFGQTEIFIRELSAKGGSFVGEPRSIKKGGTTTDTLVEAPELIKARGYYFLFYSEGDWKNGYRVKVARSKSIYGPYVGEKVARGSSTRVDPFALKRTADNEFWNVGGGSVFKAGGRFYYAYHAMKGGTGSLTRYLMIDAIHFRNEMRGDGPWPEIYDGMPSQTEQFLPGSGLTRFSSIDVTWPKSTLKNPSYSFDLIDERGKRANACLNANIVQQKRKVVFDGNCWSLNKKYILVNGFKFRVCAAQDNIWKGPKKKIQCTDYRKLGFNSTLRLSKF